MKKWVVGLSVLAVIAVSAMFSVSTFSHCQIPCGIYGDDLRFSLMKEHITTMEKSMRLIKELSADNPDLNTNQIVRWVNNKDEHAEQFTEIVTYYFMAQRVKPADPGDKAAFKAYQDKVVLLHKMIVEAMKCKQTTDQKHIHNLEHLVEDFYNAYTK